MVVRVARQVGYWLSLWPNLERIDYAATGWEGVMLQHRVADFMDLHRDEQSAGGPS
jgi:hypothetical protein